MIEEVMLIKVNTEENNNKFYYIKLDGQTVTKRYGRINDINTTKGTIRVSQGGSYEYNDTKRKKLNKGYVESEIQQKEEVKTNNNLKDIVLEQIDHKDTKSKNLLLYLIQENIHNIVNSTQIKFNENTGVFSTPLGIVKKSGIIKAERILGQIETIIRKKDDDNFTNQEEREVRELNENYLSIIPTKIKNLREFDSLINSLYKISEQKDICKALITSLDLIENSQGIPSKEDKDKTIYFNTTMASLKNKKEIKEVEYYFEKSKNHHHGYKLRNSKIINIFKINIDKEKKEYRSRLSNQMKLWHGTRVGNILSILKSSLLMPKASPGQRTAAMFGNGLYFSNQSTNSMNYCDGMFWNSSEKKKSIFIFLCSIAMGKYQVPKHNTQSNPNKGYHSYWAKPDETARILNDEMIIFNNNQIKIDYLIEIKI